MMKKKLAIILILFSIFSSHAQKELWSVNTGDENFAGYQGNITKYDTNGENPILIHEFEASNGYRPKGKLFLASNGKLYGTTLNGGIAGSLGSGATSGVLFEYNLILDKYRVVYNFDYTSSPVSVNPLIGVIEPIPGQLYGATANRVFKYNIASEVVTFYNSLPLNLLNITTEFIKAADGNLYSTAGYGFCQGTNTPFWNGCIIKFNMTTNILSVVHALDCNSQLEGNYPLGIVETSPGILNGITSNGGIYTQQFGQPNNPAGVLFEYNINTNLYSKKIDFNGPTIGGIPLSIIKGANGKLYGLCSEGGVPQNCSLPTYNFGTLFEYTPATNTLEVKQNFAFCGNSVRYPTSLIQTSVGHFMGTIPAGGLFKYDEPVNTIIMPVYTSSNINLYNAANIIEICRKPSYQEILVNTFDSCAGDNFTYDVQNTNATTYQWLKNGINLAGQTTGVLNLTNVTITNVGAYTCLMTNDCGTTTTMPFYLTVSCLGTNQVATLKNAVKLYPNPTKNNLTIELPKNIDLKVESITIFNLLGQVVYNEKNSPDVEMINLTINASKFQNGIYIVALITNYGDWNGKFIKE